MKKILIIAIMVSIIHASGDLKADTLPIQIRNVNFETVQLERGCCPPLKLICSGEIVNIGSQPIRSVKYSVTFPFAFAGNSGEIPIINPGESVTIRKEVSGIKGCNPEDVDITYRCKIRVYSPVFTEATSNNSYVIPPLKSLYSISITSLSLTPSLVSEGDRVRYNVTIYNNSSSPTPPFMKIRVVEPASRDCKGIVARDRTGVSLPVGRRDLSLTPCSGQFVPPQGNRTGVCVAVYCGYERLTSLWKPLCEVPDQPGYYTLGTLFCGSLNEVSPIERRPRKLKGIAGGGDPQPSPIKKPLVDLSVSDLRLVSDCKIQATIKNTGRVPLTEEAYKAAVQMFNNNKPWGGIILSSLDPQRRLKNPGGSVTFLWFPRAKNLRLSPGKHLLKLVVDHHNIVKESNEKNNTMVRELTCRPRLPQGPVGGRIR